MNENNKLRFEKLKELAKGSSFEEIRAVISKINSVSERTAILSGTQTKFVAEDPEFFADKAFYMSGTDTTQTTENTRGGLEKLAEAVRDYNIPLDVVCKMLNTLAWHYWSDSCDQKSYSMIVTLVGDKLLTGIPSTGAEEVANMLEELGVPLPERRTDDGEFGKSGWLTVLGREKAEKVGSILSNRINEHIQNGVDKKFYYRAMRALMYNSGIAYGEREKFATETLLHVEKSFLELKLSDEEILRALQSEAGGGPIINEALERFSDFERRKSIYKSLPTELQEKKGMWARTKAGVRGRFMEAWRMKAESFEELRYMYQQKFRESPESVGYGFTPNCYYEVRGLPPLFNKFEGRNCYNTGWYKQIFDWLDAMTFVATSLSQMKWISDEREVKKIWKQIYSNDGKRPSWQKMYQS